MQVAVQPGQIHHELQQRVVGCPSTERTVLYGRRWWWWCCCCCVPAICHLYFPAELAGDVTLEKNCEQAVVTGDRPSSPSVFYLPLSVPRDGAQHSQRKLAVFHRLFWAASCKQESAPPYIWRYYSYCCKYVEYQVPLLGPVRCFELQDAAARPRQSAVSGLWTSSSRM